MWEAAILSALHNVAPLRHENPLGDGSRPDFSLTYTDFEIIGDITSVSDKGLRENNPVDQFWLGIVRLARKYKLNPDHFRYEIDSRSDGEYGDSRTLLLLPTRKNLSAFLKAHVEPFIRGLVRNPVSRATFPLCGAGRCLQIDLQ